MPKCETSSSPPAVRQQAAWKRLNAEIVACERCPRLRDHCERVALEKRKMFSSQPYFAKPAPNFGDPSAKLLIVGLAPAAHGANRTGRMFTGDRSGQWLYRALHKAGFANQSSWEHANDGLILRDCAITAAAHCAPPDNKPAPDELAHCASHLARTFSLIPAPVILALGGLAWKAALKEIESQNWLLSTAQNKPKKKAFAHGAELTLKSGRVLLGSYHPSQQNTFTKRLTEPMFDAIFGRAKDIIDKRVCERVHEKIGPSASILE